jgi:hypothetical protein
MLPMSHELQSAEQPDRGVDAARRLEGPARSDRMGVRAVLTSAGESAALVVGATLVVGAIVGFRLAIWWPHAL